MRTAVVTGDAVDGRDLAGREQAAVHDQARPLPVGAAGQHDVDGRVVGTAGGAEQLGRGVPAHDPAALDEQVGRPRPQGEIDLDAGADVDVREQPAEPRAAQHTRA